jgi:hypothetical protein
MSAPLITSGLKMRDVIGMSETDRNLSRDLA